jgi:hypothetical protein
MVVARVQPAAPAETQPGLGVDAEEDVRTFDLPPGVRLERPEP